jgi:hypothetical protein
VPVGTYHQISVNWHGYRNTFDALAARVGSMFEAPCPYQAGLVTPYPLMQTEPEIWDADLRKYLSTNGRAPIMHFRDPFFNDVAVHILQAHDSYKDGRGEYRFEEALKAVSRCAATDWRVACTEWITRRWNQYRKDQDDGPTNY